MYYAHYDNQTGEILGFYAPDIHNNIPTLNVEITYEQWQDCLNNQGMRKIDVTTGEIIACDLPVPTQEELLTQLDNQYQPQFEALKLAWAATQLDGNSPLAAQLQTEYQTLKQQYQTAREAIING